MSAGQDLYRRAKGRIPGGTQLLSKRPEMFLPGAWPSYYRQARGIEVVDLDGRTYRDFSLMGIGACILGYADPVVDEAVLKVVRDGVMSTLNPPEEVELADLLCELHPWARMARFARGGGEAMSVAVRIARAKTRRDGIAFSGYHGWTDWYLAANLADEAALDGHLLPGLDPAGVPRGLRGTAFPFHYNRIEELKEIVDTRRGDLAAIVMEPQRDQDPNPGFLEEVRDIATSIGAVLVFDEISIGFRRNTGGVHLLFGVEPDVAVFAKALANGYAMSAVIGREEVMQAAQSTFISSTNWTERIGPAAAVATIRRHRAENVPAHLEDVGQRVLQGWREAADRVGLPVDAHGMPCLPHFRFEGEDELVLNTLFTQLMLEKGYLAWNQFKPSLAHGMAEVEEYLRAVEEAFAVIAEAAASGRAADLLKDGAARRGFYRLT